MGFVLKVCLMLALAMLSVCLVSSAEVWNDIVQLVAVDSQVIVSNTSVMTWRVELESNHKDDLSQQKKVVRSVNCFMEHTDLSNTVMLIAVYNSDTATGFHISSFIPEAGLMHRLTAQKKDEVYAQEFTIQLARLKASDTACKYYCRVLWSYGRHGSIHVNSDVGLTLLVVDPVKTVLELPPRDASRVGRWGVFGDVQRCSTGRYIEQFQLWWMDEDKCVFKCNDATRIRGFKVRCSGAVGRELSTSAYNHDSVVDWPYKQCPSSGIHANAVSYQYQEMQGILGDDTSGAELLMTCDDGTTIGNVGKKDASLGDWYTAQCPGRSKLCGFQAQVEPFSFFRDNTALNVLRFHCCD